jgi:multisubunit Na+/H+ antiporter MnhB subunit
MDLLTTGKSYYPGMGGGPRVIFMIAREDLRIALVWLGIAVTFWATIGTLALFARRRSSSSPD